ncbi:MAG TPA: hypothetical protein PK264_23535 [Hyphomicrobiaceae bacterium]|nr:hypothetical protein [Hyphomicrobiaceae bacterium]
MAKLLRAGAALFVSVLTLPASIAVADIPPCPTRPLSAWFQIGQQCRTKDGRVCTLIGVLANKQGNWSCRRPG